MNFQFRKKKTILIFDFFYREETIVDLQLPQTEHEFKYVPPVTTDPEPPVKRFKEKTVTVLDVNEGEIIKDTFVKRKFAAKKNVRKRLDDDE